MTTTSQYIHYYSSIRSINLPLKIHDVCSLVTEKSAWIAVWSKRVRCGFRFTSILKWMLQTFELWYGIVKLMLWYNVLHWKGSFSLETFWYEHQTTLFSFMALLSTLVSRTEKKRSCTFVCDFFEKLGGSCNKTFCNSTPVQHWHQFLQYAMCQIWILINWD